VLQHNQTDLEFLQVRAARLGYEVFVRDKTLYFRRPRFDRAATETLSLDQDVIAFYPRLTTMSQVSDVQVQGWDAARKQPVQARVGAGGEAGLMNGRTSGPKASRQAFGRRRATLTRQPVTAKSEADGLARGQFNRMALGYIQGEGTCYGRSGLHAGDVAAISGAGKTFSGDYYLTEVTHSVTPQDGYLTRFRGQRNAT
jgi:phage protein D